MKIRSIAIAALAAISGQVFALTPAEVADPNTVKIYLGGASALRNVIGGIFTSNCEAGTLDVFYSEGGGAIFGGSQFTARGDAHRVYACTMKGAPNASPILAGKRVALFKSDIGGSGQGVFPVHGETLRSFLNLGSCGVKGSYGAATYVCTGEQDQVPLAGVSDVEPGMFRSINTPTGQNFDLAGLSEAQIGELTVTPLFQTVFGVAVNKSLRNAMQAKQGLTVGDDSEANRPSISTSEATSYFTGALSDPSAKLGWHPIVGVDVGGVVNKKENTRVNICRRVNGSGTQAAANAYFAQFPCNSNAPAVADVGFNELPNVVGSVGRDGSIFVFEGSSTGDVISCLGEAEKTEKDAFAIGHVSKENNDAGATWRHVKLDGVAPDRIATKDGKYNYFYESTMQWNTARFDNPALTSADQREFLTAFAAEAQKPNQLNLLSGKAGVAALPDAGVYGGAGNDGLFVSRVTRGGNSCNPPIVVK